MPPGRAAQLGRSGPQAAQPFQGAYTQPNMLGNYQLGSILSASQQALAQLAQLSASGAGGGARGGSAEAGKAGPTEAAKGGAGGVPGAKKEAGKAGRAKLAASPAAGTGAFFETTARAAEGAASMAVSPGGVILDERELKKQKRKQSNRESARRSRLRKQAECEDLGSRVSSLEKLNRSLSEELLEMKSECQRLTGDNVQLQNQL